MSTGTVRRARLIAGGVAASVAIGLASPAVASAVTPAPITVPAINLQAIATCLVRSLEVAIGHRLPDPDDCAYVPGGI
jgi:hypothetical protein